MLGKIKVYQVVASPFTRLGPKMTACMVFKIDKNLKLGGNSNAFRGYFNKLKEARGELHIIFDWCTENIGKRKEDWFVEQPGFPDFPCYIFIPPEHAVAFKLLYAELG